MCVEELKFAKSHSFFSRFPQLAGEFGNDDLQHAPAVFRSCWFQPSGGKVEYGAKPNGYHCAHKADDIVGHAKVWRWQRNKQRFSVYS